MPGTSARQMPIFSQDTFDFTCCQPSVEFDRSTLSLTLQFALIAPSKIPSHSSTDILVTALNKQICLLEASACKSGYVTGSGPDIWLYEKHKYPGQYREEDNGKNEEVYEVVFGTIGIIEPIRWIAVCVGCGCR